MPNVFPWRTDLRLLAACTLLAGGCAVRTPDRAAQQFVRQLRGGVAREAGPAAFDRMRSGLRLKERQAKPTSRPVYNRTAGWSSEQQRIGLASSNVLVDAADRFDLRLSWGPPRTLRAGLLQRLLGPAYGKSATGDDGWLLDGGVLEYRAAETGTPYLLFSSPGYIRDPLDFLEAAGLPKLPDLATVSLYQESRGAPKSAPRPEAGGVESQAFLMPAGISITRYSAAGPRQVTYLAGLAISIPNRERSPVAASEFVPELRELGVAPAEEIVGAIFPSGSFAVYGNFALALTRSPAETTLSVWRRIESPQAWCQHLRPDLLRCSPDQ